jgi:hypothetical protein
MQLAMLLNEIDIKRPFNATMSTQMGESMNRGTIWIITLVIIVNTYKCLTLLGHVHQNSRGCSSADQCLLKIIDMLRKLHAMYLHIGSFSFPKHIANRGHLRGHI